VIFLLSSCLPVDGSRIVTTIRNFTDSNSADIWYALTLALTVPPSNLTSKQTERAIQLACSLPDGSVLRDDLTNQLIKTLWDNLQHPPISYLGDEFKYRTADGSNNVCTSLCLTLLQAVLHRFDLADSLSLPLRM